MNGRTHPISLQLQRPGFALDVAMQLPAQAITAVFGPSGCGKSTLLRAIAGLERGTYGQVPLGQPAWQNGAHALPTHQRRLGMVFQQPSLLSHLSVLDNLRFAQRRSRGDKSLSPDEVLARLGLSALRSRMPQGLSGGEQQRVAIARALLTQPELLLLDEPFSALDHARRQDVLRWLGEVQREWRVTTLMVTHALDEVAQLADHVVLMAAGRVQDQGPIGEVMVRVGSPLLQRDDAGAVWQARVSALEPQWHLLVIDLGGARLHLRDPGLQVGDTVRVRLLARDISLSTEAPHPSSIQNHIPGHIEAIHPDTHPAQVMVHVRSGHQSLVARITRKSAVGLQLAEGVPVWAHIKSVALMR